MLNQINGPDIFILSARYITSSRSVAVSQAPFPDPTRNRLIIAITEPAAASRKYLSLTASRRGTRHKKTAPRNNRVMSVPKGAMASYHSYSFHKSTVSMTMWAERMMFAAVIRFFEIVNKLRRVLLN